MSEKDIEHLIRSLGIGATYRGYWYLTYGINLCLKDEDYLLFVSILTAHLKENSHSKLLV